MQKAELNASQLKEIQLNILKEIKRVCNEHNITYYLVGGTLLGAVRHKGFIPWDDDIDIAMKRDDYEEFLKVFNESSKDYKLMSMENNDDYCLIYAKVVDLKTELYETLIKSTKGMGVFIDVFPLDQLGESVESAKNTINQCKPLIEKLQFAKLKKQGFSIKGIAKNVCAKYLYFTRRKIYKKVKALIESKKSDNTKYLGYVGSYYAEKEIMNKGIFAKTVELPFEDDFFSAPVLYHEYLTNLYGDYMTPPPEDKRASTHSFKAYYKED